MVKKLKESNSMMRKSISMAITCLEDIVDDVFTLNARDYSKLIDALQICKELKSKLDAGKSLSESVKLESYESKPYEARPNHQKISLLIDDDIIKAEDVADAALSWMSDDDVGEMAKLNGFFDILDNLDESFDSSVISIDRVASRLASWSADTTDEEYTEDRDDYAAKCYRGYLKDLKDKQFVNGVIDLIDTRIKNTSASKFKSEQEDLEDDKDLLDMLKTWKKVNFSK